jgi:hypothetical protein
LTEADSQIGVHLHVQDPMPFSAEKISSAEIRSVLALAALEQSGRLVVHRLSRGVGDLAGTVPRVLAIAGGELRAFFSDEGDRPLLASLIPGRVFFASGPVNGEGEALAKVRAAFVASAIESGAFRELLNDSKVFDFRPSTGAREWQGPFLSLAGKNVESLLIADPYLLKDPKGRERVADFVASLWQLTGGSIKKVTLRWQRGRPNDQGKGLAQQFARAGGVLIHGGQRRIAEPRHRDIVETDHRDLVLRA